METYQCAFFLTCNKTTILQTLHRTQSNFSNFNVNTKTLAVHPGLLSAFIVFRQQLIPLEMVWHHPQGGFCLPFCLLFTIYDFINHKRI